MSAQLTVVRRQPRQARLLRVGLYVFLTAIILLWLVPVARDLRLIATLRRDTEAWYLLAATRADLQNYRNAWTQGSMAQFGNTMFIVIPRCS
jgi:ABC-type glycerol-3-phosphate transport system permease component